MHLSLYHFVIFTIIYVMLILKHFFSQQNWNSFLVSDIKNKNYVNINLCHLSFYKCYTFRRISDLDEYLLHSNLLDFFASFSCSFLFGWYQSMAHLERTLHLLRPWISCLLLEELLVFVISFFIIFQWLVILGSESSLPFPFIFLPVIDFSWLAFG